MDFLTLAKERYACKKYDGVMITDEQLNTILEAGRVAPTAKNLQEQRIYVAKSADSLAKIDECTPCRYNAPVALVVAYNKDTVFTYPGGKSSSGAEDAAIVATHMMLAAKSVGVDSCWVNFFDPEKLASLLELPENEEIVLVLDLGYPAQGAGPLPNHTNIKPFEETITII